jgi:hypothetical protein
MIVEFDADPFRKAFLRVTRLLEIVFAAVTALI